MEAGGLGVGQMEEDMSGGGQGSKGGDRQTSGGGRGQTEEDMSGGG